MFQRFMIVCWVLFSIPAIASLASWPMYYKIGKDIDALLAETVEGRTLPEGNSNQETAVRTQSRAAASSN